MITNEISDSIQEPEQEQSINTISTDDKKDILLDDTAHTNNKKKTQIMQTKHVQKIMIYIAIKSTIKIKKKRLKKISL